MKGTHIKTGLLLLVWSAVLASAVAADKRTADEERWRRLMEGPHVKRGKIPVVKLQRSIMASAEEEVQIKKHIANLAMIERPDFGLSGTMSDTTFAPVANSQQHRGGFLLMDHQLKTSEDFRQLVALGPRALPFLLDALDDKRPTKLTQAGGIGGVNFCTEMDSNPTNSIEHKAIALLPYRELGFTGERAAPNYTVKIGDVCFAIIGQIVGRAYLAVRYQPTGLVIANSPSQENSLAKAVREIWSSTNAAQRLLDSLLFDYATEGVFNGESLDGWDIGSRLQCAAALRLLYYFPKETSGMIAEQLSRLDVRADSKDQQHWMDRYLTNGLRADEFIKAVAWSDDAGVRRELLNIVNRTTDTAILLAALAGVDPTGSELILKRLNEMIDQLPAEESEPRGDGYHLLVAFGKRLGGEAKRTFVRYLHNASAQRWASMTEVLRLTRSEWAVELLSPALEDKREFGWTYALGPGQNEPRRPIRVCDVAAQTISLSRPDLAFKMAGEHEDLDRQIAFMQARIKGAAP